MHPSRGIESQLDNKLIAGEAIQKMCVWLSFHTPSHLPLFIDNLFSSGILLTLIQNGSEEECHYLSSRLSCFWYLGCIMRQLFLNLQVPPLKSRLEETESRKGMKWRAFDSVTLLFSSKYLEQVLEAPFKSRWHASSWDGSSVLHWKCKSSFTRAKGARSSPYVYSCREKAISSALFKWY